MSVKKINKFFISRALSHERAFFPTTQINIKQQFIVLVNVNTYNNSSMSFGELHFITFVNDYINYNHINIKSSDLWQAFLFTKHVHLKNV